MNARQDKVLKQRTGSLRISGEPWYTRIERSQRDFVRACSRAASGGEEEAFLLAVSGWLVGSGIPEFNIRHIQNTVIGWNPDNTVVVGPERWNWIRSSLKLPDGSLVRFSRIGTYWEEGAGLFSSGETLILSDKDGCRIEVGPYGVINVEGDGSPLMAGIAGNPPVATEEGYLVTGSEPVPAVPLNLDTLWLVPVDDFLFPSSLRGKDGLLHEGEAFWSWPGLLVFRVDPFDQFGSKGFECAAGRMILPSSRRTVAGIDARMSSGVRVARYKRYDQSPAFLERALAEIASIPIVEEDGYVVSIIPEGCEFSCVTDDAGRTYSMPSPLCPESPGSKIDAGDPLFHAIRRVSSRYPGHMWWRGRGWIDGIPASRLFGYPGKDIFFNEGSVQAEGYADPEDGKTRVRIFPDGAEREDVVAFWDWYASVERAQGVEALSERIGVGPGKTVLVDALDIFLPPLEKWAVVYETTAWKIGDSTMNTLRGFVEENAPAGSMSVVVKV